VVGIFTHILSLVVSNYHFNPILLHFAHLNVVAFFTCMQVLEANARKVSKVRFKPISSECVDSDNKGVNRLMSKKIIKRKKKNSGDSSDSDDDECPGITENGCPAELVSHSDEKSAELEDAGSSAAAR
jgi:hypothetical protein